MKIIVLTIATALMSLAVAGGCTTLVVAPGDEYRLRNRNGTTEVARSTPGGQELRDTGPGRDLREVHAAGPANATASQPASETDGRGGEAAFAERETGFREAEHEAATERERLTYWSVRLHARGRSQVERERALDAREKAVANREKTASAEAQRIERDCLEAAQSVEAARAEVAARSLERESLNRDIAQKREAAKVFRTQSARDIAEITDRLAAQRKALQETTTLITAKQQHLQSLQRANADSLRAIEKGKAALNAIEKQISMKKRDLAETERLLVERNRELAAAKAFPASRVEETQAKAAVSRWPVWSWVVLVAGVLAIAASMPVFLAVRYAALGAAIEIDRVTDTGTERISFKLHPPDSAPIDAESVESSRLIAGRLGGVRLMAGDHERVVTDADRVLKPGERVKLYPGYRFTIERKGAIRAHYVVKDVGSAAA